MKLNKDEPFIQRVNDEQGIRYIQNDVAFNGAGKPIGKMVKGKLESFKTNDAPADGDVNKNGLVDNAVGGDTSAEAEADLDAMDLPTLKEYAKANDVPFAGNIGADKLREKIRDALSA
ncbi:MAG: hypothetical protein RQ714_06560 [Nitrosomonas sp.]|nr:hypothetical protein [Nitrosomonas sp.]